MENLSPLFVRFARRLALFSAIVWLSCTAVVGKNFYSYGGTIPNNSTNNLFGINVTGVGSLTGTNKIARLCFSISQPIANDIDVYLISPTGTMVMISTDNGGSSGNDYYTGICFSDCGPSGTIVGANDFLGVYLPEASLSAFNNGQNADGTWQLRVDDDAATGSNGTLNYWSLDFETTVMPTSPTGRTCPTAYTLTTLPYSHTCMTLVGSGNDYTNGICNTHMDGSEYVFSYVPITAAEFLSVDIAQDFAAPSGFPTVSLLDTCPGVAQPVNCIASEIQFSSTENILHITSQPLTAGKTYYIVVASTSGTGGNYDVRIAMGRNGSSNCLNATNITNEGEYAGNNYTAPGSNPQAPNTTEMSCNGSIDNFIFYTFTTDGAGNTVHADLTDIACNLSCGGACGIQVALFQAPVGGPCLGPGTWGAPVFCGTSTLANAYYSWSGLVPNTQYYLMVDGNAGSQCVWNLRLMGGINTVSLPVTFQNVAVDHASATNTVRWTTSQEINASHFEVEHATEMPAFQSLGKVAATGTPQSETQYRFLHPNAEPGWHYYRIKNVDRNGQSAYSEVVKVLVEDGGDYYAIFPNPTQAVLNLRYMTDGAREVSITGVDGKEVKRMTLPVTGNLENISIDVSELHAGVYFLTAESSNQGLKVLRFVKL